MTSIHVRAFSISDRDFLLSLVSRFTGFDLPAWRTRAEIDEANRKALLNAMDQPETDALILIAEDEHGEPAGFLHLQTQTDYFNGEKHGYISDVVVAPAFEGQGVGRLLLNAAEDWARGQGFRLLTLYVFAGNAHARRVYERAGFDQEVIKYVKPLN
ncbi:MAG: GNAT family N-acetyltransferase [Anaerolineae bacterium]|nr:GNAT family N-acetyltransferase [Anaerolineae bacterium]